MSVYIDVEFILVVNFRSFCMVSERLWVMISGAREATVQCLLIGSFWTKFVQIITDTVNIQIQYDKGWNYNDILIIMFPIRALPFCIYTSITTSLLLNTDVHVRSCFCSSDWVSAAKIEWNGGCSSFQPTICGYPIWGGKAD